jgi:hypothetical protein
MQCVPWLPPERRARCLWDWNRDEVIPKIKVVFARFIDDPDEFVAVSPSVGDLPIDFSELKRSTIAAVAHTQHVGRPRLAQHGSALDAALRASRSLSPPRGAIGRERLSDDLPYGVERGTALDVLE